MISELVGGAGVGLPPGSSNTPMPEAEPNGRASPLTYLRRLNAMIVNKWFDGRFIYRRLIYRRLIYRGLICCPRIW